MCVVNLVDERRDALNDLGKIPIFVKIYVLALERLHKALGLDIVVRITAPAHRAS